MTSVDSEHRALCHALFDAIEREDPDGMRACYAPDMTLWFNVTGETSTGEETIAAQEGGKAFQRRRTYDDRTIQTWDDGFLVQYTLNVVLHDGQKRSLWAAAVAEVRNGKITHLSEYIDSSKFGMPR